MAGILDPHVKCETDPAEPSPDEKAWRRREQLQECLDLCCAEVPADQGREDLAVTMEDLAPIADAKFREFYPREILSDGVGTLPTLVFYRTVKRNERFLYRPVLDCLHFPLSRVPR